LGLLIWLLISFLLLHIRLARLFPLPLIGLLLLLLKYLHTLLVENDIEEAEAIALFQNCKHLNVLADIPGRQLDCEVTQQHGLELFILQLLH